MSLTLKIIFVVSEDWYFLSHRMELACYLRDLGWDVVVATHVNRSDDARRILDAKLRLCSLSVERGKLCSPSDLGYVCALFRLYVKEKPTIVHHVAMKPVLFGSLAALVLPRISVVNTLAGLGYLFSSSQFRARMAKVLVLNAFRVLFSRRFTRVILQNSEDLRFFHKRLRIRSENLRLIRGAGVDLSRYRPVSHGIRSVTRVVMVARVLRDKGIYEFIEAARCLTQGAVRASFQVVGAIDEKNPNSLTQKEMNALSKEYPFEWLGHQNDIATIYSTADIAVLPSYREGLPKSLIEAAASGLPIVTTDTSGCREVVSDGQNGFLVPPRTTMPLASAIRHLIEDPMLRASMGARSRKRAEAEFDQKLIFRQTAEVYSELYHSRACSPA